ncbi:MAG: tetratricopeptide repeat protein [Myxococcales bacterium]|nr:tetratricopeptide repeat protein [Myxococcales bacterium]
MDTTTNSTVEPTDPRRNGSGPANLASLGADLGAHPVLQAQKRELMHSLFGTEAPPRRIGHYQLLEVLGAGGMGVVHAAYDEHLRRKVALKLLRTQADPALRSRLAREARAMARVTHPNVVRIYEIGEHDGAAFIAMELVEGVTIRRWLEQEPQPWRSVLSVFIAAGRGLAAVHAAGLVHRDFKPDNTMLTSDDRVLVMDFGVARTNAPVDALVSTGEGPDASASSLELTAAGAWVGTPAYMSPEQLRSDASDPSDAIDAISDQYNFCVSLWEGLYGQRPFSGASIAELARAIERGEPDPPPAHADVPRWLHHVIARGLAPVPEQRWPSMDALLEALSDDPAQRRRRRWIAAGVLALAGGGAWAVMAAPPPADPPCADMREQLAGVWDDARRAEIRTSMTATGLGYAPRTWELVERRLDDYADAWVASRAEACEATRRGEQSGELLDLRMACSNDRRVHLRAAVDVLASADATVVEKAVEIATDLPAVAPCDDAAGLRAARHPPEDPVLAGRVAALEPRLVAAQAQQSAGRYAQALAALEPLVTEAEALGHPPLLARAWLQQGVLQWKLGDYDAAEQTLIRALDLAVGEPERLTAEAAAAATHLVALVGPTLERHAQARVWALQADPLSRAAGTLDARATYLDDLGMLALSEGHHDQARAHFGEALELREREREADPLALAAVLANLGNAAAVAGDFSVAHEHMQRALELLERVLGPEHPDVGRCLSTLGSVIDSLGRWDEARRHHERALAIYERALGPTHPRVASALNNLGVVLKHQGQYADARAALERALRIREQELGLHHPRVADALTNLGIVAQEQGELADARAYLERALAIYERTLGPDHHGAGVALTNLGTVAQAEGDHHAAAEHLEHALQVIETALGAEHPAVASVLQRLGEARLALGQRPQAQAALERALAIRVARETEAADLADTRFALARALERDDPPRALDLAERAREGYGQSGAARARAKDELEAWLREHGPRRSVYPAARERAKR